MLAWIGSAMSLTAKLALGGIFWIIAVCAVAVGIGLIVVGVQKAMGR